MLRGAALAAVLSAVVAPAPALAAEAPAPTPYQPVAPARALAADAPAPTPYQPVESAPPPAPQTIDPDAALERVLRTGCREGLAPVYGLVGDPGAPWAETVLRLCGGILRTRRTAWVTPVASIHHKEEGLPQEGRGRLVFWSSLYGLWLGIATDVLFDIDGNRSVILAPMLGLGAGLGLSLALTADVPVSAGQAWTIITGLDYGSVNGALWAGGLDFSTKGIVGTAVASGIAAAAAGLAIADATDPTPGDIELVRSGLLWGAAGGALAVGAFGPSASGQNVLLGAAIAMDIGFVAGLGLARRLELSRNRVLMIDAGGLAGATLGLGVAWLAGNGSGDNGRVLAASTLVGLVGGLAIAAYGSRNVDAERAAPFASAVPALWARDPDGRWRAGTPTPLPVWGGTGTRLVGATINAVAGTF